MSEFLSCPSCGFARIPIDCSVCGQCGSGVISPESVTPLLVPSRPSPPVPSAAPSETPPVLVPLRPSPPVPVVATPAAAVPATSAPQPVVEELREAPLFSIAHDEVEHSVVVIGLPKTSTRETLNSSIEFFGPVLSVTLQPERNGTTQAALIVYKDAASASAAVTSLPLSPLDGAHVTCFRGSAAPVQLVGFARYARAAKMFKLGLVREVWKVRFVEIEPTGVLHYAYEKNGTRHGSVRGSFVLSQATATIAFVHGRQALRIATASQKSYSFASFLPGQEGTDQLEDWKKVVEYWSARPATAVHVEASTFSPAPLPSFDVAAAPPSAPEDLVVDIVESNLEKAGMGGVSRTLNFVLKVESTLPEYVGAGESSWTMRRNLEQVVSLRQALSAEYGAQCVVVPPLARANTTFLAAPSAEVIAKQRMAVLRFLRRLTVHPVLRHAPILIGFLKATALWKAPKQETSSSSSTSTGGKVVDKIIPHHEKYHDPTVDALRAWQATGKDVIRQLKAVQAANQTILAAYRSIAQASTTIQKPVEGMAVREGTHQEGFQAMSALYGQESATTLQFAEYMSSELIEQLTESQLLIKSLNRCLLARETAIVQYAHAVEKVNSSKKQLTKQAAAPRSSDTGLLSKAKALVTDDHDTKIKKLQERIESEEAFAERCRENVDQITARFVDELGRSSLWIRQDRKNQWTELCEQRISYHEEMASHARELKNVVCALPTQLEESDKWWERTPEMVASEASDHVPEAAATTE
eukprot:CAMPEP_0177636864 /NCGR_PEP_ID=MMETSP0447-20121125/4664_1 /TAXON_ID=0 /ORGANISM="Stygamoeba regulata, Strain BSH-02190019" /LENGTH=754 /DNA_ID=CAMNT_0019138751 /DNA_START=47 /DNA_END=2311 /DNA_ORIENTATION=-